MKRTELPAHFRKLLRRVPYVTIATVCEDGRPWNTPVVGYFDERLNLYWASWSRNMHSKNIASHPAVFVVVYDTSWPLGTGQALYMQMAAKKLISKKDIAQAKLIYLDRFGEDGRHEAFSGMCPRRLYKARPLKMWSNGDGMQGTHFVDVRRPIFA